MSSGYASGATRARATKADRFSRHEEGSTAIITRVVFVALLSAAISNACASSERGPSESAEEPTTTTSAPTAAAAAAAPTQPSVAVSKSCAPETSIEDQKARLVEVLKAQFPGETAEGLPRLRFDPDARDHRTGGIWVTVEFTGDELATVALKKAALDRQMRDAYQALYTSGCEELVWVDLTALQKAVAKAGAMGESARIGSAVYKTRLKREVAETIDWANKEAIDFTGVWDTLLLNVRWKKELEETGTDD
jgi:hypothetical protein